MSSPSLLFAILGIMGLSGFQFRVKCLEFLVLLSESTQLFSNTLVVKMQQVVLEESSV